MLTKKPLGWTLVYPTAEDFEWKRQWILDRLYDRLTRKLNALKADS